MGMVSGNLHLVTALLALLSLSLSLCRQCCNAFQQQDCVRATHIRRNGLSRRRITSVGTKAKSQDLETTSCPSTESSSSSSLMHRRTMLISMASAASFLPMAAYAASLEDIQLGKASWTSLGLPGQVAASSSLSSLTSSNHCPASFCTYLARFLINYDAGVQSWWQGQLHSTSLLSPYQRRRHLGQAFGKFSASLQQGLEHSLVSSSSLSSSSSSSASYSNLLQRLLDTYPDPMAVRHVGILAALLPPTDQPHGELQQRLLATNAKEGRPSPSSSPQPQQPQQQMTSSAWIEDLGALLPSPYHVVLVTTPSTSLLRITPSLPLYQVGVDDEFGLSGTATPFGPLSSGLLVRELPSYSASIYTILGLSGATGCALTHSLVIPLDVLKTKAQADPDGYSNLLQGANKVLEEEGVAGLLTGAQATLAGYFWYGMSVYPSYTFFKRCFSGSPWAVAHEYDVALIAGALASVIASLGLTPLEAARIRVVSDPGRYKPLGLTGTLQVISAEGALYAGLPSLLIRQIMFGSVKFLAFERACEVIYSTAPSLRDATWTALGVSLVAGGLAGTLSCIVSQPADSILTYVAQDTKGRAAGSVSVLSSARAMIETGGFRALFQGLGSRCVWAGSIIAGQFLLYDVFRTFFGVNANDLSQVWNFDI